MGVRLNVGIRLTMLAGLMGGERRAGERNWRKWLL